jgi:hypothetical protein
MKPKTKRDGHIHRRFVNVKRMEGEILGRKIREERRMWKRAMSKHRREIDQIEMEESFELFDEE